jgi:hypothetical protein
MEDRQCVARSRNGIELPDADDVMLAHRDWEMAVLDWRGNDVSLIR